MAANASMEEFESLLNESLERETPEEGTVVKGKVIAVENGQAIIDVGFKVEGRVDLKEFAAPGKPAEIGVGDTVEVFLDRVAAFAYPRSAYLLDPDAVGLLDEEELALKSHLVELIDALEGDPRFAELLRVPHTKRHPALTEVRELLGSLGWRAARKPSRPRE